MRIPEQVLNSLASKSDDASYKYRDLYRNLYNPQFFLDAYAKIYAKEGNMTEGTDGKTIDGMSMERIQKLISTIKDQSYQPKPAKRVYIPKSNGKLRPLGIPSIDDKLVQEVIRSLLEAIYEGSFASYSHGFRPKRSCHTALQNVERHFTGVRWFVEGDIKGFFDNIDHHTLVNILRRRIKDEKFINLLWKFLRAGYMENWKLNNTFSGTPQGGIISPILSNIYLNELDSYVAKFKETFDKGIKKGRNPEHRAIMFQVSLREKKLKERASFLDENEKAYFIKEIKSLRKQAQLMNTENPMDNSYRRFQYVRYADDFLIGIIGSKEDAISIKQELTVFLQNELKLELSQEKTLITISSDFVRFLGYDITVQRNKEIKRDKNGIAKKTFNMKCKLYVPHEKWKSKLISYGALEIEKGTNRWIPKHRTDLINRDDLEIISTFNAEIRGIYNYYKLAQNVSVLNKFAHIMKFSMYKTYANKYKLSVSKVITKFQIEGKFAIPYITKDGPKRCYFYNDGFKQQSISIQAQEVDNAPNIRVFGGRTSLIQRLLANRCQWCDKEGVPIEIHHVRKLKDLKGKKKWEQFMIAMKRKTLALCVDCHKNLHNGKLD